MRLSYRDYFFVGVQLILFAAYAFDLDELYFYVSDSFKWTGLMSCILGILLIFGSLLQLNTKISPFPTPKKDGTLIQSGFFKYIRHPIYTGIILLSLGYALYVGSGYKMIVAFALWLLFYFKSGYEEKQLESYFMEYKTYKLKTGRFFPRIGSISRNK